MSKLAYHIQHYKASQSNGLTQHNWAKRGKEDKHSNQDINPELSYRNVQMIVPERSLYMAAKKRIEEACSSRITKASNWITEAIIYPPDNLIARYQESEDSAELQMYFQDVISWHSSEFGKENILAAVLHLDETTPHLHLDMIPLTKDGKLSSKELFTRTNLRRYHTDLATALQRQGWQIERGESTEGKQIRSVDVVEYKKQAEAKKLDLIAELDEAKKELAAVRREAEIEEQHLEEMTTIKSYPEYVETAEKAHGILYELKNILQDLFSRTWILRNKTREKSVLRAFERGIEAIGRSLAALIGFELAQNVPEKQRRSKVITRSLDETIKNAREQAALPAAPSTKQKDEFER